MHRNDLACLTLAIAIAGSTGCKHASSSAATEAGNGAGQEIAAVEPATGASPTEAKAPAASALPKGVDAKDLDAAERKVLVDILADQFDPCGKPRSFHAALDAGDCSIAARLAASLVRFLQEGQGKKQAVVLLLREIERLNTIVQVDIQGAPLKGPGDGKVVVVEFSDFECPHCRRAHEPLVKLQKHYGFALYYRHFPLKLSHPNAEGAARAAWAAQQQGKFWEMHDALFTAEHLDWKAVQALAGKLGLDMKKFLADFQSPASTAAVEADMKAGENVGVDGTPTFFVNGRKAESLRQVQDGAREALGDKAPPPLTDAELGEAEPETAPDAKAAAAPVPTPAGVPASGPPAAAPPTAVPVSPVPSL